MRIVFILAGALWGTAAAASGAWVQDNGSLNANPNQSASGSSIAICNSAPCVCWSEYNGTCNQIRGKYFNGSGWEAVGGSLNINANLSSFYPSLAFTGATPYVTWLENYAVLGKIYVTHFNGTHWEADNGSLNINTKILIDLHRKASVKMSPSGQAFFEFKKFSSRTL